MHIPKGYPAALFCAACFVISSGLAVPRLLRAAIDNIAAQVIKKIGRHFKYQKDDIT
jgi:hypothetical protein